MSAFQGDLLSRESARVEKRLLAHLSNDVWEQRTRPPSEEEWSPPLPQQLEEAAAMSKLREHVLKAKESGSGDKKEEEEDFDAVAFTRGRIKELKAELAAGCVVM